MLGYMYQQRAQGIKFTETKSDPVAFVDASNKDDPVDGKCAYGYLVHWGGPIVVKSGKLNHVGINSTYNEYMALHHVIKQVVWLRQLMAEIGLGPHVTAPTTIYADNAQANRLAREDLVTAGNMYFRTTYHYNKEAVRDGFVDVIYVKTDKNISDACTKALGTNKIREFVPILTGHHPVPSLS